ncbi:hypothetical protein SB748_27885 [Rhizobium sp. SIMBA_035]
MSYGEPKSATAVVPIIAILIAMIGCILVLLSNVDHSDERQGKVFVQVEQQEHGSEHGHMTTSAVTPAPP